MNFLGLCEDTRFNCFLAHDDEPISHHTNDSLLHTADNL